MPRLTYPTKFALLGLVVLGVTFALIVGLAESGVDRLRIAGTLLVAWTLLAAIARRSASRLIHQIAESERLALHDPVTELPNRILFHDRAQQAIAATAATGSGVAVLLLDLNRFKEVNDTLGHHNGDLLLAQVGLRLEEALPDSGAVVARLGGDEFAVLLPDLDRDSAALAAAYRIAEALRTPFVVAGMKVDVEASFGIALHPEHGEDAEELLQRADVAMYVAKRRHTGAEVYAPETDVYSADRLVLVSELREAIDNGGLVVHYQPKVDLRQGRIVAVEALVRWQHPRRGLLAPREFVSLAEHTGLIGPLTRFVVAQAIEDLACWLEAGTEMRVAVNLSPRNLHDPTLPAHVAGLLADAEMSPACLEFEVTESTVMADAELACAVMDRLSAMGIGIAIDDFGTGFSSLSHLRQLPVDLIKVDKSFVLNMDRSEDDAVIVRSTIALGHSLGLEVVAEGVETQETLESLRALDCDFAQGFHVCRPIPADQLASWLLSSPWNQATVPVPALRTAVTT